MYLKNPVAYCLWLDYEMGIYRMAGTKKKNASGLVLIFSYDREMFKKKLLVELFYFNGHVASVFLDW